MKLRFTLELLLVCGLAFTSSQAQNLAGFWLGISTPANQNQVGFNYTMTLTQTGTTLGGTSQTAEPDLPFGGVATVTGQLSSATVRFGESDQNGSTTVNGLCFWRGTLTYNPTDESLIGTYENIVNGTTCTEAGSGTIELYRIVLKSGNRFCKGNPVNLVVTGKNIRWYSSEAKTTQLATGNTFNPQISQTTTFYITQTLNKTESPAVPITVEIVEPVFKATVTKTGCDQNNGTITVVATNSSDWQYSLNGGPFRTNPSFSGLGPATYTVAVKDNTGCLAQQSVTISADSILTIKDLKVTPPHCETGNGAVTITAAGGKSPLIYSINYGVSFQSDTRFTQLSGGTYTLRVRDAYGCEVNRATTVPSVTPMTVLNATTVSTSCGQANGQAILTVANGVPPIQYSVDGQSLQALNTFAGLKAGIHTLLATDSQGCTTSQSVQVGASKGPQFDAIRTTPERCGQQNGAIMLTSTAAIGFSIDGKLFQPGGDFVGLKAGTYTISLKDDQPCIVAQAIVVPLDCANRIYLPTAFSPNADRTNDALTAYFGFPSITVLRFTVYDRWGTIMYNRANFVLSTGEIVWDGQTNGTLAPAGVYACELDCQFPDGAQTSFRQWVHLLN